MYCYGGNVCLSINSFSYFVDGRNVFFFCMIMIDQVNLCLFAAAVDY